MPVLEFDKRRIASYNPVGDDLPFWFRERIATVNTRWHVQNCFWQSVATTFWKYMPSVSGFPEVIAVLAAWNSFLWQGLFLCSITLPGTFFLQTCQRTFFFSMLPRQAWGFPLLYSLQANFIFLDKFCWKGRLEKMWRTNLGREFTIHILEDKLGSLH